MKKTLINARKHKVLYMVVINLSGLHDCIYTLRYKNDDICPMWVDKPGDECFTLDDNKVLGWNASGSRSEYLTTKKAEAQLVLLSITIYKEMLTQRL